MPKIRHSRGLPIELVAHEDLTDMPDTSGANTDHDQRYGNHVIGVTIDNGDDAITIGIAGNIYIPWNCTITAYELLADQVGSITIDIWKDTSGNYPPTNADTITGGNEPALASDDYIRNTTLTGWTISLSAGDTIRFNVDSCTTIQRVTLMLEVDL